MTRAPIQDDVEVEYDNQTDAFAVGVHFYLLPYHSQTLLNIVKCISHITITLEGKFLIMFIQCFFSLFLFVSFYQLAIYLNL